MVTDSPDRKCVSKNAKEKLSHKNFSVYTVNTIQKMATLVDQQTPILVDQQTPTEWKSESVTEIPFNLPADRGRC